MPKVLNRHHSNIPADAIYIGRSTAFGNPFIVGQHGNREQVIQKFADWIQTQPRLIERVKTELKNKDLVCSCKPAACHGDILFALANSEDIEKAQARRETIARQAIMAGDLMTAFQHDRMPVALLNGGYLDLVDESKMRELWAKLLNEKGVTLPQFKDYARTAIKNGLLVFEGKNTASIGGFEELIKPIDFNERVARFLNPGEAKPAKKKRQQQGLFA
jgi:hypothetical protein